MELGRKLVHPLARRACTIAVGVGVTAGDLGLCWSGHALDGAWRTALAAGAAIVLLLLARGDRASVGLLATPRRGWRPWLRGTSLLLGLFVALVALVLLLAPGLGYLAYLPRLTPDAYLGQFLWGAVWTPFFEEGTYRLALCVGLAALRLPRVLVIVLSGLVFGLLHVLYGNPAPDNLLAGFLLAWTFVHSGTLLLPLALHAAGNAVIFTAQLAVWHLAR